MIQIIAAIPIYLALVIPVGVYLYHIMAGKHTFADPVLDRVDGAIYKIAGIRRDQQMNWKTYAGALILTNGVMMLLGYVVLRIQALPLFNPNGIGSMAPDLSFNTIISFMTNTNLQHYAGESALSNLSQMLVITFMMFVSAASGYAACAAFIRGITGQSKTSVGNFYADLVRIITRILLPFSVVGGLLLVWQGVPQNLSGNLVVDGAQKYSDGTAFTGVASGSSNYGPSDPVLVQRVQADMDRFLADNPDVAREDIPTDLMTASGSGLDPHISPRAAAIQIPAISAASGLSTQMLEQIVENNTTGKLFGVFGEETVNVLGVNVDIAKAMGLIS